MDADVDRIEPSAQEPPTKRIKLEAKYVSLVVLRCVLWTHCVLSADDEARLLAGESPPKTRTRRNRKTKSSSDERALELLKDPRLSAVEPRQVLCRMCGSWIKLFKHTDFSAANWRVHAEKCEIRTG